jgi:hypothetical protein
MIVSGFIVVPVPVNPGSSAAAGELLWVELRSKLTAVGVVAGAAATGFTPGA